MMSVRVKNGLMITAIAALAISPLVIVNQPPAGSDGKQVEQFKGSDDQASAAIQTLAPGYKPWFQSIYKTPGPEIDTLLFALQAAIGAAFIGYYIGYSRGRAKISTPKADAGPDNLSTCDSTLTFCEKTQKANLN